MIRKKHLYDVEINDIMGTIFKSSAKPLKFSGNAYYDLISQEYSVYVACSSTYLKDFLPLKDMEQISTNCYEYSDIFEFKSKYEELPKLSQVDCINIKQNERKYCMQLIWSKDLTITNYASNNEK